MANIKELSRYTNGIATTNRSGVSFLVLRKRLNLKESETDMFITVTSEVEKRLDILSYQVYGTPDLWWVICEYNNIKDPLFELKAGMNLRIPELERVLIAINEL